MTTVTAHLTNKAYGFPTRGAPRRIKAPILACVHITGNGPTAADPDRHQAARDERNDANRAGSNRPSAHYYVARDGWAIEAIDPATYAAWSNGDVASPNTANAGIAKVLALRAKGYNANEAYWLEIECVGYGSTYPITKRQKQFCATRIAAIAEATGLPVNRATVHGHSDLNSVGHACAPWRFPVPLIAVAFPILPGKTGEWRTWMEELNGARREAFVESRRQAGVQERTFLQSTPMGDLVIVTLEGDDPGHAFRRMMTADDAFTRWFAKRAQEVHGVDLTVPPTGSPSEQVIDTDKVAVAR